MSATAACPAPAVLHEFLLGRLSPEDAAPLSDHLLGCPHCQAAASAADGEDTLVGALRNQSTSVVGPEKDVEVADLIHRLKDQPPTAADLSFDFLAPPQAPDELGRLGGYRVLRLLGRGGMGIVFEAEDLRLQRLVALKVMKPELARDVAARQRFLREARAMAAVRDERIVTVHQVDEERELPFLAMELLDGQSLEQRLQSGPAPELAEVLRLGRDIALGLAAAHDRGLVHRDIKPANIWLEAATGRVKLLDFGLARPVVTDASLTQSGAIVGTPAYMAPEQARGEAPDPRCDLFSLGCVLYRLCAGQTPFQGPTPMAVLTAVAVDTPRPVREVRPAVPPPLADLVMCLLAKRPNDRPASARAVALALQQISEPTPPKSPVGKGRRVRVGPPLAVAAFAVFLVLGGIVITLKTRTGTLVVTVQEKDVQVLVDGEEKIVLDSRLVGRVELRPGEHTLIVKRGDEELYAEKFVLKSGGQEVLNARWEEASRGRQPPEDRRQPPERPREPEKAPGGFPGAGAAGGFPGAGAPGKPPGAYAPGSPFDQLDAQAIPAAERRPWQPKELVAVLGRHERRYWDRIHKVAVSPDGKLAAAAAEGTRVALLDVATLRELTTLHLATEREAREQGLTECRGLAFDPTGKLLYTATDHELVCWDVNDPKAVRRKWAFPLRGYMPEPWRTDGLALAPGGRRLALFGTAKDKGMVLLLAIREDGQTPSRYPDWAGPVSFSPDGDRVAVQDANAAIRIYDLKGDSPTLQSALPNRFWPYAFRSADTLATVDEEGTLRVWDVTGKEAKPLTYEKGFRWDSPFGGFHLPDLSELPTQGCLLLVHEYGVRISRMEGNKVHSTASYSIPVIRPYQHQQLRSAAVLPDGKGLVTGDSAGALRFWEIAGGQLKERQPLQPQPCDPQSGWLRLWPDGRTLLTEAEDASARLWRLGGPAPVEQKLPTGPNMPPLALAFDGRKLAVWNEQLGQISIVGLDDGKGEEKLRLQSAVGKGRAGYFSEDGKALHLWTEAQLVIFDLTGKPKHKVLAVPKVNTANRFWAILPGDRGLLVQEEKQMHWYQLAGDKFTEPYQFEEPLWRMNLVRLSADDRTLAATGLGDSTVSLWDREGTKFVKRPVAPVWGNHNIFGLSLSPDGTRLAAADREGALILWNTATGLPVWETKLPYTVYHLVYAPDGRHLLTGNANGTMYVLRLPTGAR